MRFLAINAVLRWASIRSPVCPASSSAWSPGGCWRPWIGGGGSGGTCRSASGFGPPAGGGGALPAFGVIESRVPEPMIELSLFRIRAFTAGNVAGFAVPTVHPVDEIVQRAARDEQSRAPLLRARACATVRFRRAHARYGSRTHRIDLRRCPPGPGAHAVLPRCGSGGGWPAAGGCDPRPHGQADTRPVKERPRAPVRHRVRDADVPGRHARSAP